MGERSSEDLLAINAVRPTVDRQGTPGVQSKEVEKKINVGLASLSREISECPTLEFSTALNVAEGDDSALCEAVCRFGLELLALIRARQTLHGGRIVVDRQVRNMYLRSGLTSDLEALPSSIRQPFPVATLMGGVHTARLS